MACHSPVNLLHACSCQMNTIDPTIGALFPDSITGECRASQAFAVIGIIANAAALGLCYLRPALKTPGAAVSAATVSAHQHLFF